MCKLGDKMEVKVITSEYGGRVSMKIYKEGDKSADVKSDE